MSTSALLADTNVKSSAMVAPKWTWRTLWSREARHANPSKIFYYLFDEEVTMLLAFIGGYVDATGYIEFDGLFTSSITGNLVAACASIYQTYGALSRAMVCVGFGLGGVLAVALALKLKLNYHWKERYVAMLLYLLEILTLLVTMVLGLVYEDEIARSLDNWHLIVVASIMGMAMGVHNAAAKESIPNVPATTVMTMTLVSLSNHVSNTISYYLAKSQLWQLISPYPEEEVERIKYLDSMEAKFVDFESKMETTFRPMLFFLLGSLVGALLTWQGTYWAIIFPMGILVLLIADIYAGQIALEIRGETKELHKLEHLSEKAETVEMHVRGDEEKFGR